MALSAAVSLANAGGARDSASLTLDKSAPSIPAASSASSTTSINKSLPAINGSSASIPPNNSNAPTVLSAEPGSISKSPGGITYYARSGDTLSSIAQQFTSSIGNWVAIGNLNRILRDSSIPIGSPIMIPAELLGDVPSNARVIAFSGTVQALTPNGVALPFKVGTVLEEGTQIQTSNNGFVTLGLVDASRISIPSNSRVKISKLRVTRYTASPRTEITLIEGRVESQVKPLEENHGRFEVRTRQSVAGVRGTRFRVGMVGDQVATEVLSGKVAVGPLTQPDSLLLPLGKGDLIGARGAGVALDLLNAPQLMRPHDYASNQQPQRRLDLPSARFTLVPLANASAYRVQVALDAEAQNLIAESRAASTSVKIDNLPDGDYFVRLSAIDQVGLEGFTRIEPVRIQTVRNSANDANSAAQAWRRLSAPCIETSDKKSVTWRWQGQPGQQFTLQVARDAEFSWLLASTVVSAPAVPSSAGAATAANAGVTLRATVARPGFGTYYARVQRNDEAGNNDANRGAPRSSAIQRFIVTDQWVINDGDPIGSKAAWPGTGTRDLLQVRR